MRGWKYSLRCVRCGRDFDTSEGFFGVVSGPEGDFFYCPGCARRWWIITPYPRSVDRRGSVVAPASAPETHKQGVASG